MAGRREEAPHSSWQPPAPPRTRSELRAAERAAEQAAQQASRPAGPSAGQRRPLQPPPETGAQPHRYLPRRFTVLLTLFALLLLGWASLCFIDTGQPELAALTGLAPVLSVLALPVLAISVARRQILPAVMALAAAVVPWALVADSAVAGPGPTSAAGRATLRVLTVDGGAGDASAPTIVRAARNFDVDVLVVTSLTSELAHDLTGAGLNSMVTPRWVSIPPGRTIGAGLWSQQPIGAAIPIPGVRQPATATTLITDAGPISLVVAHAGGSSVIPDGRWRSDLRALYGVPVSGPRILAGDLGVTPWNPAFRRLTARGWHEAADVLGRGLRPTWPSWGPVPFSPLDQVMVGGGIGVSRADTITIPGTSHRALLVSLVLPNRSPTADPAGGEPGGSGAGDPSSSPGSGD